MIFKPDVLHDVTNLMSILLTVNRVPVNEVRQALIQTFQEEENKELVYDHYCLFLDVLNIIEVLKQQTFPRYQTILDELFCEACSYEKRKSKRPTSIPLNSNN